MAHFPLYIELNNKPCLIVGGGSVAARKAGVLLSFGAKVTVVSHSFCEELEGLPVNKIQGDFTFECLAGRELVVAATSDTVLNHEIATWCKERGVYVNSATSKMDSTFLFPAVVQKEGITIGITSEGKSPAVTRQIRKQIERCIPDRLEERLEELERIRELVKEQVPDQLVRKEIFYELIRIGIEQQESITIEVTNQVIDKVMYEYEHSD